MQLFGNLDVLSFVRVRRLNWIGHVNRMDSRRRVSEVFNNNPQGSRLRGRPKNRWWNCVQTDINKCKIANWKRGKKTEWTGRSPLRRRRSTLDCSAVKEEVEMIIQHGGSTPLSPRRTELLLQLLHR